MKNRISLFILSAALLGSATAMAQSDKVAPVPPECADCGLKASPVISVLHYAVDSRVHYTVGDCVPFSDVELYSTPSGGEVVAYAQADEKGKADFLVKSGTPVAFALNHNRVNAKGVAGKGQILVIPQISLELKSPDAVVMGNDITITWDASSFKGEWHFTLQKSSDNIRYTPVYETDASNGRTQGYTFRDKADASQPVVSYRILATDKQGNSVMTAEKTVKLTGLKTFFTASPTVFNNTVQVNVPGDKLPATYTLTDALGRTRFASGIISKPSQVISLNLISGSYRLTVIDKNNNSGVQWLIRQ